MAPLKATATCDMGEVYNEALMQTIHLTNIARGYHASDFSIMNKPVTLAKQHGVLLSPPRFGRREIAMEPDELLSCLVYQIGALAGFLELHEPFPWRVEKWLPLHHSQGAVYGQTAPLAPPCARRHHQVAFIGLAGQRIRRRARRRGVVRRLDYDADWRLLITKTHEPVSKDVATLLEDHKLTTNLGGILPLGDSLTEVSICCHSKTNSNGAVGIARLVKSLVDESNQCAGGCA
ncbi:lactam utilization protein lamb [Mycena leptocephala]|nr:lactam utilization protein lamb [Mycena leptocephala]